MPAKLRPLVHVNQLGMTYGFRQVFRGVTFHLKARERVALVGRNGAGKSTLLRILAGRELPTDGSIRWLIDRPVVAYHPQEPDGDPDLPVREHIERAAALNPAGPVDLWAWCRRWGLDHIDLDRPFGQLSGGQKTRVSLLARTLTGPDLLLLDEPTNHLDHDGLRWLEQFVLNFGGCLLVVSHDRAFLDRVAERVLELSPQGIREYMGGYTQFREAKEAALRRQEQLYSAQQKRLQEIEEAITRQQAWANKAHREAGKKSDVRAAVPGERKRAKKLAQAAKARIRRLERMKNQAVARPEREPVVSSLNLAGQGHGRTLVVADGLGKRFDRWLFQHARFSIDRGERVALIGPNGAGKTTLIRLIIGEEAPSAGRLWTSPVLRVGLLEQEVHWLEHDRTVLEEALSALFERTPEEVTRVRTLLHHFLFRPDDLGKATGTLSTGEKKRLALLKLVLRDYNLLILDEPLEHLDVDTREKLEEVLSSYTGTLLFTSHDRWFLRKVSTKVLEIAGGTIIEYPGGYAEYERRQQTTAAPDAAAERLVLETRLAYLAAVLAQLPKDDPGYGALETEYLDLSRRLRTGG